MGYTNFWNKRVRVRVSVSVSAAMAHLIFQSLLPDTKLILINLPSSIVIGSADGEGGHVNVNDEFISFNGVGKESHEDFFLSEESLVEEDFSFCKTERKPYDLAVMAVLLRLSFHSAGLIQIESDGDANDWQPAFNFCRNLFGHATLPPTIRTHSS